MKIKQVFKLLLVFYAGSCAGKTPEETTPPINNTNTAVSLSASDTFSTGKVIDTVVCKADPTQSYALYIPAKGNTEPLPVIYFFDPHGSGALPLNKYKSLADEYGFIMVGSNNSKNGTDWPTTETSWLVLFADTRIRLKINFNRVYTGGFSGGAKVASYVALQHSNIKGVIANGAGLPDGMQAGNFNFSFTAIAGEGDMNLTELVAISNELDKTSTRHHLILFDGKHEWAPLNTMELVFEGLQLDAMQAQLIPRDDAFISQYIAESKKRLDAFYKSDQLIRADDECKRAISYVNGLTKEADWFKTKAASLESNSVYQKQQQAQKNILITEQVTKEGYMQRFQQPDKNYWVTTISDLQKRARARSNESAMCQRLLAYLSLAFYSYSSHLLNANADNEARYFVDLYKIADPSNSEAWYFSAILNARNKQAKEAENDLLKAVEVGFRDKSRMLQQPEFQQISPPINFAAIESRMSAY